MCQHQPPCPPARAPDRAAAHTIAAHPEQGWSLLCNGVVLFEDGGELLPGWQAGRTAQAARMEPALPLRGQLMRPFAQAACGLVPEAGKTLTANYMLLPNGQLKLSEDGKAMKYFELAPFELRLTAETITRALRDGDQEAGQAGQAGQEHTDHTEESDT